MLPFNSDFTVDVWIYIYSFCDINSLLKLSLTNKRFHAIQDTTDVWRPRCSQLWKEKQIRKDLYHRCNFSSISSQLTIREIRRILELRNQDTTGMVEKSEFLALLYSSNPLDLPDFGWNKWKLSYYSSLVDSKRTVILKEELCEIDWLFTFKSWGHDHPGICVKFFEDGTYETAIYPERFHWQFSAGGLILERFPVIIARRTLDWGWELENLVGKWIGFKRNFS